MRSFSFGSRRRRLAPRRIGGLTLAMLAATLPLAWSAGRAVADDAGAASRARIVEALPGRGADGRVANWYRGEIFFEGQWRTIAEIERLASSDEQFAQYKERRRQLRDAPEAHARLARWCEKHGLKDQADVHWLHVLRFDSENSAALAELVLAWHDGMLMDSDERDRRVRQRRQFAEQQNSWGKTASRLRREIDREEQAGPARSELMQIRDPAALPALIEHFTDVPPHEPDAPRVWSPLIGVLANIDSPQATEALAALAAESEAPAIRYATIEALRSKRLVDAVPALIARLQTPVDASISVRPNEQGVINTYSYYQEGPGGYDYSHQERTYRPIGITKYRASPAYRWTKVRDGYVQPEKVYKFWCPKINQWMVRSVRPEKYVKPRYENVYIGDAYLDNPRYAAARHSSIERSQIAARGVTQQAGQLNRAIEAQNKRTAAALREVTGETFGAFPKSWWNWWKDYLDRHPEAASQGACRQLSMALLNQDARGLARGTLVWTIEGRRPIDSVLPGDFVLSQNPNSGELSYQAVLATNRDPLVEVQRVGAGGSQLFCTAGHIVWRSGVGWQRVSKIDKGAALHGVMSEPVVADRVDAYGIDVYDLIVDESHAFFAGQEGLLVHDATAVTSVDAILPGVSSGASADVVNALAASR